MNEPVIQKEGTAVRERWQLMMGTEFETLAVEIAKLLDGLTVSEAEAVLQEAAGILKMSHYVNVHSEEFAVRVQQYLRSRGDGLFHDERLERKSPVHPTVTRLLQFQRLMQTHEARCPAIRAEAGESLIADR
jgi:hypothetical protein